LDGAQRRPACGWKSTAVGADRAPLYAYTPFLSSISLAGVSVRANAGISCGRDRRPGGPARRVLRRRRDGSGRQLYAELA